MGKMGGRNCFLKFGQNHILWRDVEEKAGRMRRNFAVIRALRIVARCKVGEGLRLFKKRHHS